MTPEEIEALTDVELLTTLKLHDISCGPIVDTTRSLYQNKLKKLFKEKAKKHPAAYIKRSEASNKVPSSKTTTRIPKENHPPPIIENISPIRYTSKKVIETQTDDVYIENARSPISELRSNFAPKKAHSTPKLYPDLNEYNHQCPAYRSAMNQRQPSRPFMQQEPPVYNFYQSQHPAAPKMEFKLLNPDLIQNRPQPFLRTSPAVDSGSRLHNFHENYQYTYRYEQHDQPQQQRPLLNLAGSLHNQRSLYDEPAPPQPAKKVLILPKNSNWPNAKGWLLIGCFLLLIFWFSWSTPLMGDVENPIKTYKS